MVKNVAEIKRVIPLMLIGIFGSLFIYYGAFIPTPPTFGDEPFLWLIAKSYAEGNFKYIPRLYADGPYEGEGQYLFKPMLYELIPTFFYLISFGNFSIYKLFSPIFGILLLFAVYYYTKKYLGVEYGLIAMAMCAGVPLLVHFTLLSYHNIPLTFFFFIACFKTLDYLNNPTRKNLILAGIFFGLSLSVSKLILSVPLSFALFLLITHNFRIIEILKSKEFKSFILITLIGFAVCTPSMKRDNTILHNPIYPEVQFISTYRINKKMWDIKASIAKTPLSEIFSFGTLNAYMGYYFFPILIGIAYSIYKWDKNNLLLLSFIATGLIVVLFIATKDIRYIMHLVPLSVFLFCSFLKEFLPDFKYKTHILLLLVVVCIFIFAFEIRESGKRINDLRALTPSILEAYKWLATNTTNAEYNILDLFTPRALLLLYYFDPSNQRGVTFPHPHAGSGEVLWHFWEYPDARQRLKSCKIKYIVVEKYFFTVPYQMRKFIGWTHLPEEFVKWADDKPYMERVFENRDMLIYEVEL